MKITKNKNQYFSYLQKQYYKIAVVLVVISMFASFLNISPTYAYFSDEATSAGNTFTAGTLAFHLDPSADFTPSALNKGDTASLGTTIAKEEESLGFQYTVATTDMTGDPDLCNALTLTANLNGVSVPTGGAIPGVFAPAQIYASPATWNFAVNLPSGASDTLQDKTCNFKFTFNGWQEGLLSTQGFSDTKQISATIKSGHWVAPVVTINPGDVVINEIMWMGSTTSSADEWLELRNTTGSEINIGGWQLTKKSSGSEVLMLTIPAGKTILPNGFFLISEYDQVNSNISVIPDLVIGDGSTDGNDFALANEQLQIKLYKGDWNNSSNLIDTADDGVGNPVVGSNDTLKQSMERHNIPGDGISAGSWHPCINSGCNSGTYWKTVDGNNYGTPGGPNLSTNDPTSPDYDPNFIPEQETIVPEEEQPITDTTTDNIGTTDTTIDTTIDADTTTEDETVTTDQPAQDTEDATALDEEEDPAIESEATELESAVESTESSNIQADEPEASSDEVVEETENE